MASESINTILVLLMLIDTLLIISQLQTTKKTTKFTFHKKKKNKQKSDTTRWVGLAFERCKKKRNSKRSAHLSDSKSPI